MCFVNTIKKVFLEFISFRTMEVLIILSRFEYKKEDKTCQIFIRELFNLV